MAYMNPSPPILSSQQLCEVASGASVASPKVTPLNFLWVSDSFNGVSPVLV